MALLNKNVGEYDRKIRLIISMVIFGIGFYFNSLWGLLGIIPLYTGLVRICPIYSILGISTVQPGE
jgi:hypothetical protein